MNRMELRSMVRLRIMSLEGVDSMEFLDRGLREKVEEMERGAEGNGAVGGLMPFVNAGVWDVLTRHEVFIIVAQPDVLILSPQQHLVHIVDQNGQIIGEYLPEGRREDVVLRENAYLISEDFVLYGDVEIVGEPYFRIPTMTFPFLEDIPGIKNIASASISTISDEYLRNHLGFVGTKHWTHLVGFDY